MRIVSAFAAVQPGEFQEAVIDDRHAAIFADHHNALVGIGQGGLQLLAHLLEIAVRVATSSSSR